MSIHLLTLLQLQSYLVPFISKRIYIIPKLQNIHLGQFYTICLCEPFSLCIELLPNCFSVRSFVSPCPYIRSDWAFRGHISRALPTDMILYLLRSSRSEFLLCRLSRESNLDTLKIIIMWLQVSVIECKGQNPQTKILIVSRDLVPSERTTRSTCIIASRVNFFVTNVKRLSFNQVLALRDQFLTALALKICVLSVFSNILQLAPNVINLQFPKNIFYNIV